VTQKSLRHMIAQQIGIRYYRSFEFSARDDYLLIETTSVFLKHATYGDVHFLLTDTHLIHGNETVSFSDPNFYFRLDEILT